MCYVLFTCIPSSIELIDTKLVVGLVANCNGAFVDIVMMLGGGGRVAVGGLVIIGGLVTVACVTKCSGFVGFSAAIL